MQSTSGSASAPPPQVSRPLFLITYPEHGPVHGGVWVEGLVTCCLEMWTTPSMASVRQHPSPRSVGLKDVCTKIEVCLPAHDAFHPLLKILGTYFAQVIVPQEICCKVISPEEPLVASRCHCLNKIRAVQGYLAYKKTNLPRTLFVLHVASCRSFLTKLQSSGYRGTSLIQKPLPPPRPQGTTTSHVM
jgi:hypothetical protein